MACRTYFFARNTILRLIQSVGLNFVNAGRCDTSSGGKKQWHSKPPAQSGFWISRLKCRGFRCANKTWSLYRIHNPAGISKHYLNLVDPLQKALATQMPLATKAVFASNPLVIILLINSVPEMLSLCDFCLAGSNVFETNSFIEFGFFLVWGDPSTSWTRSKNVVVQKDMCGISTVKCGWHLAFVSTLFEDHRRGPWQRKPACLAWRNISPHPNIP